MSFIDKSVDWVGKHPYTTGAIVIVGGLGLLFLMSSGGGSSSSGSGDAATSAYFQAEAAQGVAGDQLQATQIAAQASTNQALIQAGASENINSTWATADVAQTSNTNAAEVAIAPYAAEGQIAGALVGVANAPPLTTTNTSTSKNNGFFGLFGSNKQSTTVSQTANPAAVSAEGELSGLLNGFTNQTNGTQSNGFNWG